MAELAYARVLGARPFKGWGFDSPLSHHTDLTRGSSETIAPTAQNASARGFVPPQNCADCAPTTHPDAAKTCYSCADNFPPDLRRIIEAWPSLPEQVRASILDDIRGAAASGKVPDKV